jgi:hypothetical protein
MTKTGKTEYLIFGNMVLKDWTYISRITIDLGKMRGYLRSARAYEKPPSISKNTLLDDQNLSPKKVTKTGKSRFPNLVIFLYFRI